MIDLLLEASLRSALITAGIALLLVVLRVRSGAWQHAAWTLAMLTMLAAPALVLWRPTLPVSAPHIVDFEPVLASFDNEPAPAKLPLEGPVTPSARAVTLDSSETAVAPTTRAAMSWTPALLAIWAIGGAVMLTRLWIGSHAAARLLRVAHSVSSLHHDTLAGVPVLESPAVAAPVIVGIVRPAVVLPSSWPEWPEAHLAAVLAHEAAHVRRYDAAIGVLARVNRAVYWFNPAAWWLERAIARSAEVACDDEVIARRVDARRYAEVLLATARAIEGRGHRVAWGTLGIGGGRLASRIERALSGAGLARVSRPARYALAIGGAAVALFGIACQQAAAPLRPNEEYGQSRARAAERWTRLQAAAAMSDAEVTALEARLEADPGDLEGTDAILYFYQRTGQELYGWNQMIERRRPHLMRLIANHPASPFAERRILREHDPRGYEEGRVIWMAHAEKADAPAAVLAHAADFISPYDKPGAEALLGRAIALEPTGPHRPTETGFYQTSWKRRLGELYARAALGVSGADQMGARLRIDSNERDGAFAAHARLTLEQSTDDAILVGAATWLQSQQNLDRTEGTRRADLLDAVMARAVAAAGSSPRVRRLVAQRAGQRQHDEHQAVVMAARKRGDPTLATLSDRERFNLFRDDVNWLHLLDFGSANSLETPAEAERRVRERVANEREYAETALTLAERFREDPEYGTVVFNAKIRLSLAASRESKRAEALEHLQAASQVPPSPTLRDRSLGSVLGAINELIKAGERETIIAFLERLAEINTVDRDRWLADAAALRSGQMTMNYHARYGPE